MTLVLGPILRFLGADPVTHRWTVSVLVVVDGEHLPMITWSSSHGESGEATPAVIAGRGGRRVVTAAISVTRRAAPAAVTYQISGVAGSWSFTAPARAERPRSAYASCNGFSSLKAMKSVDDKYALWRDLAAEHDKAAYHLLLLGGDQIYADSMWESIGELEAWNDLRPAKADAAPFSGELAAKIDDFFFDLYLKRWAQPDLGAALSSVPTLMMWDDHDIFDGWGSYSPQRQNSPVFQGIYASARRWFRAFQLHLGPHAGPEFLAPAPNLTYAHRIDDLAFLVLDLRSERCAAHVMSPGAWAAAFAWLEGQVGVRHALVLTSIPVIYPELTAVQDLLGRIPGQQELEDDLRDHWCSRVHQGERLRLIHRLLDFSRAQRARVSILSGDVHVAGLGLIEDRRAPEGLTIAQVISSGIVHPPPPAIVALALGGLMGDLGELDRGISASMQRLPGSKRRLICARNWLSLEPDDAGAWPSRGRLWMKWRVEGDEEPYTMVVPPLA